MAPLEQEIQAEIAAIETDASLRDELAFNARVTAMDRLEVHVLDRIAPVVVPSGDLVALKQRAEHLYDLLAEINENIFSRLRAEIRAGGLRGDALVREFERYVFERTVSDLGYDQLDLFVNGLFRLETAPQETRTREPEMVFYQPTPARVILELTGITDIAPNAVFYDLGSGLGHVCLLVHLLTGVTAKGVEFEPSYCDYARQSARRLNLSQIEFINRDARDADYTSGTIFFIYTSFRGKMLEQVLRRVKETARIFRICTYGPCTAEVARQTWLRQVAQRGREASALAVFEPVAR